MNNYADRFNTRHFELAMTIMQTLHNSAPFYSGNLRDSIKIVSVAPKTTTIEIAPLPYRVGMFREKGIIIHKHGKSYAYRVNKEGKHKNWVDKNVMLACKIFATGIKAEVKDGQ